MRRALDLTQVEFAEAMELAPETVSGRTMSPLPDRPPVRHNIFALLYKQVSGALTTPKWIARMRFTQLPDGQELPPITMVRIKVARRSQDSVVQEAWDEAAAWYSAAAA
jgi:hypothetical protein